MRTPLLLAAATAGTLVALATACSEGGSVSRCPTGYTYGDERATWPVIGQSGFWYAPYDYWEPWPGPYDWSYWGYPDYWDYPYSSEDRAPPASRVAARPVDAGRPPIEAPAGDAGSAPKLPVAQIGPSCWECPVICTTDDKQRRAASAVSDVSYDDACRMATNAVIAWASQNLGKELKVCVRPGEGQTLPGDAATPAADGGGSGDAGADAPR